MNGKHVIQILSYKRLPFSVFEKLNFYDVREGIGISTAGLGTLSKSTISIMYSKYDLSVYAYNICHFVHAKCYICRPFNE